MNFSGIIGRVCLYTGLKGNCLKIAEADDQSSAYGFLYNIAVFYLTVSSKIDPFLAPACAKWKDIALIQ